MARYEVNIRPDPALYQDFVDWLREEHLHDMLKLPGFIAGNVYEEIEEEWAGNVPVAQREVVASYELSSIEALHQYLDELAPKMRNLLPERFRGKLSFRRRVLRKLL